MRLQLLVTAILLSHFSTPIAGFPQFFPNITSISPSFPHFFPNISSIPPSLLLNATFGAWQPFQKFAGCHMGNKSDGFAKLKQYFHRFGYISDSPFNFTDVFDESFESALKTYQLNFNLNPTGVLDAATLQQIVRPRCGVADIINGSTSMNSGKDSSSSSPTHGHFHTVGHFSFFPGKPRWPVSNYGLTYAFSPENQISVSVKSLFSRAFDRWSTVTPLTFTLTDFYDTADIKIGFLSGDHGDGEPFDGLLGTLAHAFSPPNGRFHLDGDENWVIDGDVRTSSLTSAIDLESVVVHEIGHLLGLGHSSDEAAIMFPTISSGTRKIELAGDDIDGIQMLYGSNPKINASSSTSSMTPSSQEREMGNSGAHVLGIQWVPWTVMSFCIGLLML